MKTLTLILIFVSATYLSFAQANNLDFQSDPKLVLEEIFNAAKTNNYSKLSQLCPPDGSNDEDTQKYICNISSAPDDLKQEFKSLFSGARITGEIVYKEIDNIETAKVPFWFNHPGGENRCFETMNMIKIGEKWYLSSF